MDRPGTARKARVALAAALAAATTAVGAPAASAVPAASPATSSGGPAVPLVSRASGCPVPAAGWRTAPTSSPLMTAATVRAVTAGRHACFDRFVVTLRGSAARSGFYVGYVGQVTQDGSGHVVPLRGAAKLLVVVRAPAYDSRGRSTYNPRNRRELVNVAGYRTFRQIAWAGSFEGQTTFGLGVRAKLPFRVFVLKSGTTQRLVVDVSHAA